MEDEMLTLEEARRAHDTDLRACASDETAARVLRGRGEAATAIRLALARVFARPGIATHEQWQILPCLTPEGTIGVVDVARGTAWDTTIPAPTTVEDLGLEGALHAGANQVAGDVRIDGRLVQRDGATPGQPVSMPPGWRQIALPTWRGYTPDAHRYDEVPVLEYAPERQVRPRLAAWGLMTCYGHPGDEPPTAPDGAAALGQTSHGHGYPWGVPAWVIGQSVSVVDTLIAALSTVDSSSHATGLPRRSEAQERVLADRMLAIARQEAARRLRLWADSTRHDDLARSRREADERLEEVLVYRAAANALDDGQPASSVAQAARLAVSRGGNRSWSPESLDLDAIAQAERATCAWEVARVLGYTYGAAILQQLGLVGATVDPRELVARCRPALDAALATLGPEKPGTYGTYGASLADQGRGLLGTLDAVLAADAPDSATVEDLLVRAASSLSAAGADLHLHRVDDEIRRLRVERFAASLA